jgi:hypothetical protein
MRRRWPSWIAGLVLIVYGAIGIALFVVIGNGLMKPIERAQNLAASVEDQRAAIVDSLETAEETIRTMSHSVERMDTSLGDAKTAIDRASFIAHGVASSMYQLRDSMNVEIPLIGFPLAGLAPSFDTSGQNLDQLGVDIANVGTALDSNRADVILTANNLGELASSVGTLTDRVNEAPSVDISERTLEQTRMAIIAVSTWMALLGAGLVLLGLYLIARTFRRRPVVLVTEKTD